MTSSSYKITNPNKKVLKMFLKIPANAKSSISVDDNLLISAGARQSIWLNATTNSLHESCLFRLKMSLVLTYTKICLFRYTKSLSS